MDSNTTILKTLEDINIILFHKIMTTNDYTLLVIEGNKDELREECEVIWNELFDDYFKRKGDGRALNSLKKHGDLGLMRIKLISIQNAISTLALAHSFEDVNRIVEVKNTFIHGFKEMSNEFRKLNPLDNVADTIDKLTAIHSILKRKYDLVDVRKEQVKKAEDNSIEDALVDLQNVLGYSFGDFKTISVPHYLSLVKAAKKRINSNKKK